MQSDSEIQKRVWKQVVRNKNTINPLRVSGRQATCVSEMQDASALLPYVYLVGRHGIVGTLLTFSCSRGQ